MSEDDPDALRERVRELEQTADELRETVEQLQQRRGPSRRDLLKVGSGGLLGAGLLASSQPVSAAPASADTSAGQVGVAGDSEDIVLDQAYDPGGDEILNVDDSGGINAQFGRPWYFNTIHADTLGQDLDADSNDLTNVGAVETDEVKTAPTGSIVFLDGNQIVADNTLSEVEWATETNRGVVSNLLSNNAVVVPSGYNWAHVQIGLQWEVAVDMDVARLRLNGSNTVGGPTGETLPSSQLWEWSYQRIPVSQGDEITLDVRHQAGADREIVDFDDKTYLEVVLA
jgi:hypothetical protein